MSTLYSHPHITTNVYDNSEIIPQTNNTDIPTLFQPYFSERGVSNKLETYANLSEFIKDKGKPNFKKYGQSQYNIVNWLSAGGRVLGVRLTAPDAKYANVCLNVKTKALLDPDTEADNYDFSKTAFLTPLTPIAGVENIYKAVLKETGGKITSIEGIKEVSSAAYINLLCDGADFDNIKVYVNNEEITYSTEAASMQISLEKLTREYADIVVKKDDEVSSVIYFYNVNGDTTKTGKADVKLETVYLDDLTSDKEADVKASIEKLEEKLNKEETDGYKNHVLVGFISDGSGVYGNNYGIRISENPGYNRNYDFSCYSLTLMETDKTGSVKIIEGPVGFSFYPEAISVTNISLNIVGIVKKYFPEIGCYFNETAYDKIVDDIMEITNNAIENVSKIDFINGMTDYISVNNTNANALFNNYSGQTMDCGSDGTLSNLKYTDEEFVKLRGEYTDDSGNTADGLFTKLFSTDPKTALFPELLDTKRYYIDVVLDFNTCDVVKDAMQAFVQERGDCVLCLDCKDVESAEAAVQWKQSSMVSLATSEKSYLTSLWSQYLNRYDSYSASTIGVTSTYYLASIIPDNDLYYGTQYPFVGPNRGVIEDFDAINWLPSDTEKESLYDNKINYIEESYKTTKFNSQLTVQNKNSALSDVNHVRTLLKIIRSTEELVEGFLFESATDDTINSINTVLNNKLSEWVTNGTCTTCNGTCSQTELEAENKTAHVTLEIVFVDVIEKIVIDVNVSR